MNIWVWADEEDKVTVGFAATEGKSETAVAKMKNAAPNDCRHRVFVFVQFEGHPPYDGIGALSHLSTISTV